jgi:hypothetical protein
LTEIVFDLYCTYRMGFVDLPLRDARQPTVLRGTDASLDLIQRAPKGNEWSTLKSVPIGEVVKFEIESIEDARHEFGWKATTGFLNRGTQVPNTTGVLVVLRSGEHVLFEAQGMAPIEVRAVVGPWTTRFVPGNEQVS